MNGIALSAGTGDKMNKMFQFHYSTKINVYHSRSYFSLSLMPYQIS